MFGKLKGYKTYVAAVLAALAAIGAYLTGDMSGADAFQACLTALIGATVRHGISTRAKGAAPLLLVAFGAALLLPSCTFGDGKYAVTYQPGAGVCVGTAGGEYAVCWNPGTGNFTAKGTRNGVTVQLQYDKATGTWRGTIPGSGGEVVYDKAKGARLEPALPVASSAK